YFFARRVKAPETRRIAAATGESRISDRRTVASTGMSTSGSPRLPLLPRLGRLAALGIELLHAALPAFPCGLVVLVVAQDRVIVHRGVRPVAPAFVHLGQYETALDAGLGAKGRL